MKLYDYSITDRNGNKKDLNDYEGNVVGRYSHTFKPEDMEADIKKIIM